MPKYTTRARSWSARYRVMAPPPIGPLIQGSATPAANDTATAASTASPPAASTCAPASAALRCCDATSPPAVRMTVLRTTCVFESALDIGGAPSTGTSHRVPRWLQSRDACPTHPPYSRPAHAFGRRRHPLLAFRHRMDPGRHAHQGARCPGAGIHRADDGVAAVS